MGAFFVALIGIIILCGMKMSHDGTNYLFQENLDKRKLAIRRFLDPKGVVDFYEGSVSMSYGDYHEFRHKCIDKEPEFLKVMTEIADEFPFINIDVDSLKVTEELYSMYLCATEGRCLLRDTGDGHPLLFPKYSFKIDKYGEHTQFTVEETDAIARWAAAKLRASGALQEGQFIFRYETNYKVLMHDHHLCDSMHHIYNDYYVMLYRGFIPILPGKKMVLF